MDEHDYEIVDMFEKAASVNYVATQISLICTVSGIGIYLSFCFVISLLPISEAQGIIL